MSEKELSARYELPRILYDMLEDAEKENKEYIVSWMPHGRAFKVHKGNEFESKIMPRYFFEKYDSFRRLLEQWGFLRISRGKDRGAYFHHRFIRGKRELCATASKTEMVHAMPEFLSASEEPDLYASVEQDAVTEEPSEHMAVTEEVVKKSSQSDAKSQETTEKIKLKASKPKGGTEEDTKSRDKTSKTKARPSNRKEKARSKSSKKRKTQEEKSAAELPERESDTPSPKLSRTQRLLKIPLCRYYLPPLNFSPRPSYSRYATTNPFDFTNYDGSTEQISKD